MADPIEPALSAEEWINQQVRRSPAGGLASAETRPSVRRGRFDHLELQTVAGTVHIEDWNSMAGLAIDSDAAPAAIALLNATLKDDDKRKITLGTVVELRRWAEFVAIGMKDSGYKQEVVQANFDRMRALADALSSYLPPE